MIKRWIWVLLLILVVALLFGGSKFKEHRQYVSGLEEFRVNEFTRWIGNQAWISRKVEESILEVLASNTSGVISKNIVKAKEIIADAYNQSLRGSGIEVIDSKARDYFVSDFYNSAYRYMDFLSRSGDIYPLEDVKVQELKKILKGTELIREAMTEFREVVYTEEWNSNFDLMVLLPRQWKAIRDDQRLGLIVAKTQTAFVDKGVVGYGDDEFLSSGKGLSRERASEFLLINSPLKTYTIEEIHQRHDPFIEALIDAVRDSFSGDSAFGDDVERSMEINHDIYREGNYYFHKLSQDRKVSAEMSVITKGARTEFISIESKYGLPIEQEVVKKLSLELFWKWATHEGLSLDILRINSDSNDHGFSMTIEYCVIKDGVRIRREGDSVQVNFTQDGHFSFRIFGYGVFYYYDYPYELIPQITKEEAIKALSPLLESIESPVLELHDENRLLYRIKVSGIDGIDYVLINAINGEQEGVVIK